MMNEIIGISPGSFTVRLKLESPSFTPASSKAPDLFLCGTIVKIFS